MSSIALFFAIPAVALACDFCSCLTGINPFLTTSTRFDVVMLYQHSSTATGGSRHHALKPMHGGGTGAAEDAAASRTSEQRLSMELSFRQPIFENWDVGMRLPLRSTWINRDAEAMRVMSVGDPIVLLGLNLHDPLGLQSGRGRIGIGLSLPVAPHDLRDASELLDLDLQPGSGTVDLLFEGALSNSFDGWSAAIGLESWLHITNEHGDRRGHSVAANLATAVDLFRENSEATALLGLAGMRVEGAAAEVRGGRARADSDARTLWGTLGAEVLHGSMRVRAQVLLPIVQHRHVTSPTESTRLTLGVGYVWE